MSLLSDLQQRLEQDLVKINLPNLSTERDSLESKSTTDGFWDNAAKAGQIMQKLEATNKTIALWSGIKEDFADLETLDELSRSDDSLKEEFITTLSEFDTNLTDTEITLFLSGPYDTGNCFIAINAGTGGVDAKDWSEMLMRMYIRYAEDNDYKVTVLEKTMDQEAGISSCLLKISGQYAYGYLKGEQGVHRLIRMSPFNAKGLRQTSFAGLEVTPEIMESTIELNDSDLKVDVFRASGAGGQSVNTTDSAVRITHLPTNTVVTCQNERSQLQNKQQALAVLKGKLAAIAEQERQAALDATKNTNKSIDFGSQIRTFTLQPYTLVKDHRTNTETTNVSSVLDGNLKDFINANIKSI